MNVYYENLMFISKMDTMMYLIVSTSKAGKSATPSFGEKTFLTVEKMLAFIRFNSFAFKSASITNFVLEVLLKTKRPAFNRYINVQSYINFNNQTNSTFLIEKFLKLHLFHSKFMFLFLFVLKTIVNV